MDSSRERSETDLTKGAHSLRGRGTLSWKGASSVIEFITLRERVIIKAVIQKQRDVRPKSDNGFRERHNQRVAH